MKKLFFIICSLFMSTISEAQWTWQYPIPQGNDLLSVFFTDINTGYASGEVGTIIKTIDGGKSWTILESETRNDLNSICFFDANTGYAIGEEGIILRTTNGGTTWTSVFSGTKKALFSICFVDSLTGYIAGGGFVEEEDDYAHQGILLKTTDGGKTWHPLSIGRSSILYSVCFSDLNKGYAVGESGYSSKKTIDGGNTWTNEGISSACDLYDVCFSDASNVYAVGVGGDNKLYFDDGLISKTMDNSTIWTNNFIGTKDCLESICFLDANNGYVAGGHHLAYSDDSVATSGLILKTMDGGANWSPVTRTFFYLNSIFFVNHLNGYAVGERGAIYKTIDGGTTWTAFLKDKEISDDHNTITSIRFSDANTGYAFSYGEKECAILKTEDAGSTWTTLSIDSSIYVASVFFVDAKVGFASGSETKNIAKMDGPPVLLRTDDGGLSWSVKWEGTEDGALFPVYFTDVNTGYGVYLNKLREMNDLILKTVDGGTTWDTCWIEPGNSMLSFFFTDANVGFAVGGTFFDEYSGSGSNSGIILKTIDAGSNWSISHRSEMPFTSVQFPDKNIGYAVTHALDEGSMVFKTSDGGENWFMILDARKEDEFLEGANLTAVYFTDFNVGYLVGSYRNAEIILKTVDGGASWFFISIPTDNKLSSVYFTDSNTGYAAGENRTILKTINGGGFVDIEKTVHEESSFTIYPNPANNKITISNTSGLFTEGFISVFNVRGELLIHKRFQNLYLMEMDVSSLQKGIYFIKIQNKDKIEIKKLVIH